MWVAPAFFAVDMMSTAAPRSTFLSPRMSSVSDPTSARALRMSPSRFAVSTLCEPRVELAPLRHGEHGIAAPLRHRAGGIGFRQHDLHARARRDLRFDEGRRRHHEDDEEDEEDVRERRDVDLGDDGLVAAVGVLASA